MKNKDVERALSHLKIGRETCLKFIDQLSFDEIITIPQGFNNSIYWNIAHLAVTQQMLQYKLAGEAMYLSDEIVNDFRKGSTARVDYKKSDWENIKKHFISLPDQMVIDYEAGKFQNYHEYATSFGVTLTCIEDAIAFNNIHEGMHIGYVMALKRAMSSK